MTDLTQITDYNSLVRAKVLSQYNRALRVLGIVEAGCVQADTIEQAMFEIRDGLWIRNAVGVQLDLLGRVYRVPRRTMTDDVYRQQLQFQAATLVNGNPEEILTFLSFVTGLSDLGYLPEYPAGFAITTSASVVDLPQLELLAPAGVHVGYANPMDDAYGNPMQTATGAYMYALV